MVMQSGVGDIGRHNIYHTTNKPYAPTVSIRQHITKKTSEIVYLNLRKASVIRAVAILPNSLPSTGWRRGYLTTNCIEEIFDVGELKYTRTRDVTAFNAVMPLSCSSTRGRYSRIEGVTSWYQSLPRP